MKTEHVKRLPLVVVASYVTGTPFNALRCPYSTFEIVISSDDASPNVFAVEFWTLIMLSCVVPHADRIVTRLPARNAILKREFRMV
jgi:hypothetical protein